MNLGTLIATGILGSCGAGYSSSVLATSPVRYWPLSDTSGSTLTESVAGDHGTYVGATLADTTSPPGTPAPYFDGINDYGEIFTAGLSTAIDMAEGCVMVWLKPGVDAYDGNRTVLRFQGNGDAIIMNTGSSSGGRLNFTRIANNVIRSINNGTVTTNWINLMLSWSEANNEVFLYVDGTQVGQMDVFAASASGLEATNTRLASTTPSSLHNQGHFAHLALWGRPADADILALASV